MGKKRTTLFFGNTQNEEQFFLLAYEWSPNVYAVKQSTMDEMANQMGCERSAVRCLNMKIIHVDEKNFYFADLPERDVAEVQAIAGQKIVDKTITLLDKLDVPEEEIIDLLHLLTEAKKLFNEIQDFIKGRTN